MVNESRIAGVGEGQDKADRCWRPTNPLRVSGHLRIGIATGPVQ